MSGRLASGRLVWAALVLVLLSASVARAQGVAGWIDSPAANSTVMQPFTISGWAIHGPGSGTGIDVVQIYECSSACVLWGTATYGIARTWVASTYGAQFLNSGYSFTKAGLTPGSYYLQVRTHSTITGAWYLYGHSFTVQAGPEHTVELPVQGASLTSPLTVQGWALDASAPSGTGVSSVNVWAYPNPGSGQPYVSLGTATYGINRPDIATSHGERFRYTGYTKSISGLAPGPYYFQVAGYHPSSSVWSWRSRTAYVDAATLPLTIDRPGTGTGGVTASGLTCTGGSTTQAVPCGASYPLHTVVTLTAAPDANSTFAGWGGACTGTGTCQVTLSAARFVVANFTKLPDTIATRYYHTDVIGSVRAITDEAGGVVARNDYRPFGEDVAPLGGDPNRFAGKQLDPETALHYFDARYYRQTWGRFTSVDPVHVGAAMTDPQQMNRYAYAKNNPLAYADPSGLAACKTALCERIEVVGRSSPLDSIHAEHKYIPGGVGDDCDGWDKASGMSCAPRRVIPQGLLKSKQRLQEQAKQPAVVGGTLRQRQQVQQAARQAKNDMQRKGCSEVFKGASFDSSSFNFVLTPLINQNPAVPAGYAANSNPDISLMGTVYIATSAAVGFFGPGPLVSAFGRTWTLPGYQGMLIVAEMGHAFSEQTGFLPDAGDPDLGNKQHQDLINACYN